MKAFKKASVLMLVTGVILGCTVFMGGCSMISEKRIVRIAHSQSETHPEHLGLLKFKEYIEENLGDKYEVQIYPNELLGGQTKVIELTQTGAIDFVVVGTPNLENFADVYEVFSMPYLFTSEEAYHSVMNDVDYMQEVHQTEGYCADFERQCGNDRYYHFSDRCIQHYVMGDVFYQHPRGCIRRTAVRQ